MSEGTSDPALRAVIAAIHAAIGEVNQRMHRERLGSLERARAYGETVGLDKAASILHREFSRNA